MYSEKDQTNKCNFDNFCKQYFIYRKKKDQTAGVSLYNVSS